VNRALARSIARAAPISARLGLGDARARPDFSDLDSASTVSATKTSGEGGFDRHTGVVTTRSAVSDIELPLRVGALQVERCQVGTPQDRQQL
jgi:hypothetical protein